MTATAVVLLLADGRFPSGGHAHSGGLEAAAGGGRLRDVESLAAFLDGRLATAGMVAAALAAAACGGEHRWGDLDAEADARMPAPAARAASRRLGRQLLRAGSAVWPGTVLTALAAATPSPHQAVVLGAVAAAAGLGPLDAARVAAYEAIAGPAAAAVRLLGLDPFAVHALLASRAADVEAVATRAQASTSAALAELPAPAAPLLDVAAEDHANWEVRLFAS